MTTTEPPAATVARAATALRAWAHAATPGSRTVQELPADDTHRHRAWWVDARHEDETTSSHQTVAECLWREGDARLAAAMSPAVARALADALDQAADALDGAPVPAHEPLLALARQILGEAS